MRNFPSCQVLVIIIWTGGGGGDDGGGPCGGNGDGEVERTEDGGFHL